MKIRDLVICDCHSVEHQLVFLYETDDKDWHDVFLTIHLQKKSFWKRLVYGVKYILGRQCNYGAFDEMIIPFEDVDKFQRVVDFLNKVKQEREKNVR